MNELQKTDLKEGTGEAAKVGDKIRVHYKGTLAQTSQRNSIAATTGVSLLI